AKAAKSRGVRSVTGPAAEIHVWQALPHRSGGPSLRHSKRIVGGSELWASAKPKKPVHATARPPSRILITLPLPSGLLTIEPARRRAMEPRSAMPLVGLLS